MITYSEFIILFTSLITFIGGIFYIIDTLKWKTKPNRVTWWIWALSPMIATVAMYFSNWLTWNILPVFIAWFVPLLVFIASFVNPKSFWELHTLDYICLILSLLALILWLITKNPSIAIIFSVLSDFFAALPSVIKMYKYPETESISFYFSCFLSALSAFLVIHTCSLNQCLFPAYLVVLNFVLILLYYRKKFNLNL